MLDATALCGYNRVKSVNTVFIESQSKSQGPGGRGSPPLALGTLVKSPRKAGVQVPGGPWHSHGVWSTASAWLPLVLTSAVKSL